jgi:predicted signal transduction protein with EAL and GGDEF domain
VNDTLGHHVGDALLIAVADRLRACAREADTVARLGGDEFVIVQSAPDKAAASELARRVIDAIAGLHELDGQQVVTGASIGIAFAPDDGKDTRQLLRNADMALYRAKSERRGTFRFFEPAMDVQMQARRQLELDMRGALERGEFELHYQPLIKLQSGAISGFEALLRWRHPKRGLVGPAEFIFFAEETGLIAPLGDWIIRQACADAATWPRHIRVAVNLSSVQFKSDESLVTTIFSALAFSHLEPSRLEVEITESVLLKDSDHTLATLHRLRDFGVRISMDDFGTGYSSLSYLRSFPFDKIKIDQSFIRDVSDRDDSMAIIRAVTGLGTALGIATTAEGVETSQQLERLRSEGCTEVQGYFFSRPRPAAQLGEFFSDPKWTGSVAA